MSFALNKPGLACKVGFNCVYNKRPFNKSLDKFIDIYTLAITATVCFEFFLNISLLTKIIKKVLFLGTVILHVIFGFTLELKLRATHA